jgi:dynein heavy chain
MIASLRDLAKSALLSYPNTDRVAWTSMYPGQIVLGVSQVFWTKEVEKAIADVEKDGVAEYLKVLVQQIEGIV